MVKRELQGGGLNKTRGFLEAQNVAHHDPAEKAKLANSTRADDKSARGGGIYDSHIKIVDEDAEELVKH